MSIKQLKNLHKKKLKTLAYSLGKHIMFILTIIEKIINIFGL